MALINRRDYADACDTIAEAIAALGAGQGDLIARLHQLRRDLAEAMPPLYRNVIREQQEGGEHENA